MSVFFRLTVSFVYILTFFFLSTHSVFASIVFEDNFDYRDETKWEYVDNGGEVNFDAGVVTMSNFGPKFPVLYSKLNGVFVDGADMVFEARFKYNNLASMGTGINIGYTGSSDYPFYQFSLWQDAHEGSYFMYNDFSLEKYGQCTIFSDYRDLIDRQYWSINLSVGEWHVLKIEKIDSSYVISLDDVELYETGSDQCLAGNIILGNPLSGGSYDWNSLSIDYVRLVSLFSGETIDKVVLIPGLGASWNSKAMVYNQEVGADEWKMTPFVKTYDGLVSALEAKGLVRDRDFFVWNYDWRQPVEEISKDFDDFVVTIVGVGEKIDLVGHSLGGLVARVWSQNNLEKVDKVISLGSPHRGSLSAYDAWSGAKISDKFDVRSIALNLLLQLQKKNGQTGVEVIRKYAPVLKDLLPTFDFAKMGRQVLSLSKMESKNSYLIGMNASVNLIWPNLKAMVAKGEKTKEWTNLAQRTIFEEALGIWPDGKVIDYEFGDGDGTVLLKSAKFEGDDFVEIETTHSKMVGDLVDEIFTELDLGEVVGEVPVAPDLESKTVFFVGSPVKMRIDCDGNVFEDDMGFIMLDENEENCQLELVPEFEGTYHLVIGNNDNGWQYYEGEVLMGETVSFGVEADSGELLLNNQTADYLYGLIKRDTEILLGDYELDVDLEAMLTAVENKDTNSLTDKSFSFRKRKRESVVSKRIMDNLEKLLIIENGGVFKSIAESWYRKAMMQKSMVETRARLLKRSGWRPTLFGADSYEMMTEKIERANDKRASDYAVVTAASKLVIKLAGEVL